MLKNSARNWMFFDSRDAEVLEDGEVPVRESRANADVPPGVAELLHRRIGIRNHLRECGGVQPRARSFAGRSSDFWPETTSGRLAEKPVISGAPPWSETSVESKTVNGVPLIAVTMPLSCHPPRTACVKPPRLSEERQAPLIAEDEAMARVEERRTAFGGEVERILRQIVFAGDRFGGRAGHVEGGGVVDRFGVGVGREEGQAVAEALLQADFERVVAGIGDARDQAG